MGASATIDLLLLRRELLDLGLGIGLSESELEVGLKLVKRFGSNEGDDIGDDERVADGKRSKGVSGRLDVLELSE